MAVRYVKDSPAADDLRYIIREYGYEKILLLLWLACRYAINHFCKTDGSDEFIRNYYINMSGVINAALENCDNEEFMENMFKQSNKDVLAVLVNLISILDSFEPDFQAASDKNLEIVKDILKEAEVDVE